MKKPCFLIGFLLIQLIITAGIGTSVAYGVGHDKAPNGLHYLGVDLSGLSESEALQRLEQKIPAEVSFNGQVFPLVTTQSRVLIATWLHEQYTNTGKGLGATISFLQRQLKPLQGPEPFLDRNEIIFQLEHLKKHVDHPSQPAKITYSNGNLIRQPAQAGLELDIEKSWQDLIKSSGVAQVPLEVKKIILKPSDRDIAMIQSVLGDYTTYFNSQDVARTNNVRLAANSLDGRLIPPGGTFSFNQTVGERTESVGYLPAYIFWDQQVIKGDGGGVCQDSSTLYESVQQAHLPIEERHSHSLSVTYVRKGQDATVAFGTLDFRFRNDTQSYILISARTGSNWLRVRIFGMSDQVHPALTHPDGYPIQPQDWVNDPK